MATFETVSTHRIPSCRKVQFWNQVISAAVARATADPLDEGSFHGELKLLDLGEMRLAEIRGGASHVRRLPVRTRDSYFVLQLVLSGGVTCSSQGNHSSLAPGDMWMFSPGERTELTLPQPASLLAICVQRELLGRYIAYPESVASLVVSGRSGAGALVGSYLREFWHRAQQDLPPNQMPRFAEVALHLLAGAYSAIPQARLGRSRRLVDEIHSYIEQHLSDTDLMPQSIAAALGITTGYLHRTFSRGNVSLSRYILRRRLEESWRELADCMQNRGSITAIAFRHGFNSPSHFCRAFRDQFGLSPTQVRDRAARGELVRQPGIRKTS